MKMIIFAIKYNKVYTKLKAFMLSDFGSAEWGRMKNTEGFHVWLLVL